MKLQCCRVPLLVVMLTAARAQGQTHPEEPQKSFRDAPKNQNTLTGDISHSFFLSQEDVEAVCMS
jgi:hypothetical protein